MRAIAKTYSPEMRGWAASLHRRRVGSAVRGSRLCSRNLLWAQSLANQFARRFMNRLGGERTLLHRATARRLRSQYFASHWQLSCLVSAGFTGHAGSRTFVLPASRADREVRGVSRLMAPQEIHREFRTLLQSGFLRHTTCSFLREIERHTKSTTLVERAAARGGMTLAAAGSSSASRGNQGAPESISLAERVRRQSLRTEETWTPAQTVLLRRAPVHVQEAQFVDMPSVSFPARQPVANSVWAPPAVQANFNINHITDEVVRKLDSRLIAARERFGKI